MMLSQLLSCACIILTAFNSTAFSIALSHEQNQDSVIYECSK